MEKLKQNFFSLCKRISKEDIIKVFSFTAISTLVRMLTGLISVKIVASIIGPSGVALVGQLNNFSSIIMSISSGGINGGITKYIAEYRDDLNIIRNYLSTALRITIICSFCVGVFMIIFHSFLSEHIMLSSEYGYVFIIFGFTVLLYALNMMITSIINGFKEFKQYVQISIANSIIGLAFTLIFVLTLGLKGALISAITYQSIMLFVTFWMVRRLPWFCWDMFKRKLNFTISQRYFRYTLMTLTTAVTLPVSQMLLRGYVISQISPVEAGWWEAMNRISAMYLMVITSSFSVYYLPRLSELNDIAELRREIFKSYKVIVPILFIGFIIIYFLRSFIIRLLFTPEFFPMENLFVWQLIGDFFKICSWVLSYLMVAKSMIKSFVATEILFSLSFVCLGFIFIHWNGVVGITQAYLINYIAYTLCMIIIFRRILFNK